MAKLIFLIALVAVGYIGYHLYGKSLIRKGPSAWIKPALAILIVLLLLAVATGRANAIFAVIGAAIAAIWRMAPLLLRFAPQLSGIFKQFTGHGSSAQADSRVRTQTLIMTLDHESGEFDGKITEGEFTGRTLSSLGKAETQAFAEFCRQHDPEALKLISAFVARYHPDWQVGSQSPPQSGSADMSTEEALSILGLDASASEDDIVLAHRRLMVKLHPDKGGNDYLATKINQAKDYLIKQKQADR